MQVIQVEMKPEVRPKCPSQLEPLKPYRIVEVTEGFDQCAAGDIVVALPGKWSACYLNATKQKVIQLDGREANYDRSFRCLRAFDVKAIWLAIDNEDAPQ